MLLARFGVSERRACTVAGLHRSTRRLGPPPVTAEEAELRVWLREFSTERPRWGWRRAAKMARRAGWKVNNKRVRRLWRDEGLRVPQRRRKKRLTGIGAQVGAMCPIRPNVIWAMDFQFDTTADGRTLKLLNVIDEFTREALAIEIGRSIDADGASPPDAAHRSTSGSTTAPSSSHTPSPIGAGSTARGRCSSTPARHGRTPGSNRSTAAYATNSSTRGASTASSKHA